MSVATEDKPALAEGSGRRRRRRSWSAQEKRRIVAETFEPGASVSIVARRHDVNANQVFTWRRRFGAAPPAFVPVVVPPALAAEPRPAPGEASGTPSEDLPVPAAISGRMEIVLGCGSRIVVDRTVNAAALARVIEVLGRRAVGRRLGND